MSEDLRWADDPSQPPSLREAITHARSAGPSARELEALIASVHAAATEPSSLRPSRVPGPRALFALTALMAVGVFLYTMGVEQDRSHDPPSVPAVASPLRPEDRQPPLEIPANPPPPAASPEGAPAQRPTAPRPGPARRPTPPRAEQSVLEEAKLLRAAKQALAAAPSVAAAQLELHRKHYPNGGLVEEREALAIEIAWHRGKHSEARLLNQRFRARYPESAYLRRLDLLLRGGLTER